MSVVAVHTRSAAAPGPTKTRSPAIYGIRGLAALALLTVHVAMFSGLLGTKALGTPRPPSNFVGAFFVSGLPSFIGVFFVLPAMFLYLPLAKSTIAGTKSPPAGAGLLRRLVRLLPAYYLMCLVALVALNRDSIDGLWYILRPILLLQVYLPSPFVPKLMNGMEVTWTVPSMVQWYLVLPLIAWATHQFAARGSTPVIRARRLMLPVPILIGVGIGWLFFVKAQGWDNRIVFWWPQGFAPTIGIGMALAILLARSQVSPQDTPRVFRVVAAHPNRFWLGALAVYLVNCARPFSVIGMDAIYSVSGLLVTYLMVAAFGLLASLPLMSPGARPHAISTLLSVRPVAYLGEISYGVYLWHFAMMHFFLQPGSVLHGHTRPIRELYGTSGFWRLELVTFTGSVILASISYHLVEQPLAARVERFLRNRNGPGEGRVRMAAVRGAPANTVPARIIPATAMSREEATSAVAAAAAECDAVRSNLVELEGSFGRRLVAGTNLTGQTRQRWEEATADLTRLWEYFDAYSAVVDDAVRTLTGARRPGTAEVDRVAGLLTGQAVLVIGTPAPLARRSITDDGRQRLELTAAIQHMNQLFTGIAALVGTAEVIHDEVTPQLNRIDAELARTRRHASQSPATTPTDGTTLAEALAEAEAELHRLRHTLATDPLALWRDGRIDSPDLDALVQGSADLTRSIHCGEPGDANDHRD